MQNRVRTDGEKVEEIVSIARTLLGTRDIRSVVSQYQRLVYSALCASCSPERHCKIHQQVSDQSYDFMERYGITGVQAAMVMFKKLASVRATKVAGPGGRYVG